MSPTLILNSIVLIVGLALGAFLTHKFMKPEIVTKTEIKEVVRTDVQTKEIIVKQKDGTETITRVITDKSVQVKDNIIITETEKKLWNVALFGGLNLNTRETVYGLSVQKQYIGAFSLGMFGTTSKELGASLGYSF